ncbi:unnamed protein product [Hymenolepis diminuta]|uniref:Uncharacterized protein n=1 Tax=Hymenolepis diminuta TaxID=6216 RepID=A0A3P6ZN56_HYMDI|nr:unnamed protein product [Hymenolepis diminuta]
MNFENSIFGQTLTDHMLVIHWTEYSDWENSKILPLHPLQASPGAQVLHFGNIVFEDMKSMKGVDGKIRKFRPRDNPSGLKSSALSTFNEQELLKCIKKILRIDSQCVSTGLRKLVYIRSTIMSTEPTVGVGKFKEAQLTAIICPASNYHPGDRLNLSMYAETNCVKAWPGETGDT